MVAGHGFGGGWGLQPVDLGPSRYVDEGWQAHSLRYYQTAILVSAIPRITVMRDLHALRGWLKWRSGGRPVEQTGFVFARRIINYRGIKGR